MISRGKCILFGFLFGLSLPWLKLILLDQRVGSLLLDCHLTTDRRHVVKSTMTEMTTTTTTTTEATTTTTATKMGDTGRENDTMRQWSEGSRVRILCWFMTDPSILKKLQNVRDTWSKRCDVRLFMSSEADGEFPAVGLDVPSGRSHIAAKSRASWTYVYDHYVDQADYFMKADPDSYVVLENLKLFLASRSPEEPAAYGHALYFGRANWLGNFSGFYTAGQSVVLSRESLRRLVQGGIDLKYFVDGQAEDLKTIVCLEKRGGYLIDTRDILGRETFMPAYGLSSMLAGNHPSWYTDHYRKYLGYCRAVECLSPFPIVFHYVSSEMYLIDYLTGGGGGSGGGYGRAQHRRSFVEDAVNAGLLKFNGSILKHLVDG